MKTPRAAPIFIVVLALLGCVVWAVEQGQERDGGRPTNFGVKDGSVPDDPREAGRGDHDYPSWPISKELPNDTFTFAGVAV